MRRIGLLGGMSWESSIEYERLINQGVREQLGGTHSADLVIRSYDFAAIEALQAAGEWDAMGDLLASDARQLERSGAEVIALCTNTMHRVAGRIEQALDAAEFVHIGDATAGAVMSVGIACVGLVGTRYTMEHDFLSSRLTSNGIEVLIPDEPDRTMIHHTIYDELVRGVIDNASRRRMVEAIDALRGRGATGVIAGCTEIELLVGPDDIDAAYFPTARLHAAAIVERCLTVSASEHHGDR
ncbi:MAG: aspartate/glutamate racemase family protein [Actinomycetota bacterium]